VIALLRRGDVDQAADVATAKALYDELARQEVRADHKANQVLQQTAILATLAVGGIGGLGFLVAPLGVRVLLAAVPLGAAIVPWGWAMIVALRQVVRPNLFGDTTFTPADEYPTVIDFYRAKVVDLRPIVRARFRAIQNAVDLQCVGLGLVALALVAFGTIGVLHLVANR